MALYRISFKWRDKDLVLKARKLDMTHPYFVSLKDLVLNPEQRIVIDPSQDFLQQKFSSTINLMLPVQTVQLVEEIEEEPFTLS